MTNNGFVVAISRPTNSFTSAPFAWADGEGVAGSPSRAGDGLGEAMQTRGPRPQPSRHQLVVVSGWRPMTTISPPLVATARAYPAGAIVRTAL